MKYAALFAFLAATADVLGACPTTAPGTIAIETFCPDRASATEACPNGPVSFEVVPIQPCDQVTWDFDDGKRQTVIGSARVTHEFPVPGNYYIWVTVTNSLGTSTLRMLNPQLIASAPSRLSFVTQDLLVPPGGLGLEAESCINCVVASESSGTVTITVERSLDVSRRITATAKSYGQHVVPAVQQFEVPLTFLPGETRKSFTVPIENDDAFFGPRFYPLYFDRPMGGTFTSENASWQPSLVILDDDPRPTLSIVREISMQEGSGLVAVPIPLHLSEAMLSGFLGDVFHTHLTTTPDDFVTNHSFYFPSGLTQAAVHAGFVNGDTRPEPDERLIVRIASRRTPADPVFGVTEAVLTILNDDAAFVPRALAIAAGATATLKLDFGSPYRAPTTIYLVSSDAGVLSAPATMVIPPGVTTVDVPLTAGASGTATIEAIMPGRFLKPATVVVTGATPPRRRATRH